MATERPRHGWRPGLPGFATRTVRILSTDPPVARCSNCGARHRGDTPELLALWVTLHDAECDRAT